VQLIEGEAGKSLADLVALNIGQMGENMALGHIDFFASPPGHQNVVFVSALWWIRILWFLNYNWPPRSGSVILNHRSGFVSLIPYLSKFNKISDHINFFASPPGDQNVVFASVFCGSGSCGSLTIIGLLDPDT
jgi:hypothetical protein